MALLPRQTGWFDFALGTKLNPDLAYGLQCVDTVDHYGQYIFGVHWRDCIGSVPGGARQLMDVAPSAYWLKVWNDDSPTLLPQKGDVIVFDGWATNPYGHTGVVESADVSGVTLIQQDGFAAPLQYVDGGWYSNKPTHRARYEWASFPGRCRGWLRPRAAKIVGYGEGTQVKNVLDGVDVSQWQGNINLAAVPADFVIIKASGGTGIKNPYLKAQTASARKGGKLVGFYHFASDGYLNTSPKAEADFFLAQTAGLWTADTMAVLDFEHASLQSAAGVRWALEWLDYVAAKLGKKPLVYTYLSVANALDWAPVRDKGYLLWLAHYPTNAQQSGYGAKGTRGIPFNWQVVMWQYSQHGRLPGYSGDLDLNLFYGTKTQWLKYAGANASAGLGAQDDWFDNLDENTLRKIIREETVGYRNTGLDPRDVFAILRAIPHDVFRDRLTLTEDDGTKVEAQFWAYFSTVWKQVHRRIPAMLKEQDAKLAALTALVGKLAEGVTIDADEVKATVDNAVREAMKGVSITLSVDDEPDLPPAV